MRTLLAVAVFAACTPPTSEPPREELSVETANGPVRGVVEDGVQKHLGVPFAVAERFRAPSAPPPWTDVRSTEHFGPACPHGDAWGPRFADQAEDCLTLNVFAPERITGALPVVVWVHGGSYLAGTPALPDYDGTELAKEGVVVVSLSYRLGVLGFFAHEDLDFPGEGNQALLDMLAGLQWVQDNIANFGGDPENVTFIGESAGGQAACAMMLSDESAGLMNRVVMMSGVCAGGRVRARDESEVCDPEVLSANNAWDFVTTECAGEAVMRALGCDDLACLEALPVEQLVDAVPYNRGFGSGLTVGPTVDGHVLDANLPFLMFTASEVDVDLLIGHTRDEPTIFFAPGGTQVFTEADRRAAHAAFVQPGCVDALMDAYPAASDTPAGHSGAYLDALRDGAYLCPNRTVLEFITPAQSPARRAFLYRFSHVVPAGRVSFGSPPMELGAYHSSELPIMFGSFTRGCDELGRCFDDEEVEMSDIFRAAIVNFATSGDPGWEAWSTAARAHREMTRAPTTEFDLGEDSCPVWDAVYVGSCG